MNVVFVGPPGAGKGTQAARLSRAVHLPVVASGDLLRAVRAQDSPLGNEAKRYMDKGKLVPDDLTIRIIEERMRQPDAAGGVILDGFPRTLPQARALDGSVTLHGQGVSGVDLVIYIRASREVVLERMKGRWICQQCATVYHIPNVAPQALGTCDVCGAPLYQRHDETPEIQTKRYDIYERDTLPIVDYYRQRDALVEIDGEQDVVKVSSDIRAAVYARRATMRLPAAVNLSVAPES